MVVMSCLQLYVLLFCYGYDKVVVFVYYCFSSSFFVRSNVSLQQELNAHSEMTQMHNM